MPEGASNKSACPATTICIAAMRGAFWICRLWDFHADALTPCNVLVDSRERDRKTRGIVDVHHRRRPSSRYHCELADAAGHHHLRLRHWPAQLRPALQPR